LGATKRAREIQAAAAFAARGSIDTDQPYLLIDDVYTTGATIRHAAQQLVDAGASAVWVAVICRQPLDQRATIC